MKNSIVLAVAAVALTACMSPVYFGDNTSEWANDGECDDPRFAGPGMATTLLAEDSGHDAVDCKKLHAAGQVYMLR